MDNRLREMGGSYECHYCGNTVIGGAWDTVKNKLMWHCDVCGQDSQIDFKL